MKKLFISVLVILAMATSVAKGQTENLEGPSKTLTQNGNEIAVYKLIPTENVWTFIKLNTRNGKMWQVQYDVEGDNRSESFLNVLPLVTKENEVNGRFTLYSTQNMYTFILLDQLEGNIWQVQWSVDIENRLVLPIK